MHPLHERALRLCQQHRRLEFDIIEILDEIDRTKLHKSLGYSSLFTYSVKALQLSEATAYQFISVMRSARKHEALRGALKDQEISVAKASRIVSAIDHENERDLVKFAVAHSSRETEREVARLKPRLSQPDRSRFVAEDEIRLECNLPKSVFEKLERAKNLQRDSEALWQVLDRVLDHYLSQKDPVVKARRLSKRPMKIQSREPKQYSVGWIASDRRTLTAAQTHAVNLRDGGRCTHVGADGERCENTKWLEIHHIRPVSLGGDNEPENLTTLCSFHHDLAHQLSLPVDGQVTWLRAPLLRYG